VKERWMGIEMGIEDRDRNGDGDGDGDGDVGR